LYEGKILASDTPENLQRYMSSNSQVIAEIAAPEAELKSCWMTMPEIAQFDVMPVHEGYLRCSLTPQNGLDLRPRVAALAQERGWSLRELTRNRHSLEDIYVQVTGPEEEEET
jgi:ABC-2 type transport system ATP-binding protein